MTQLSFPFAENRYVQLRPWWGRSIWPVLLAVVFSAAVPALLTWACYR